MEGSPNGKLTFNNKQNASGHDIYIIEEIAKKMGYDEVQLHAVDFSALIPSINNGTFDVAITAMGLTPERQEIATPSIPYLYPDMGMLVRSDDPRFSDIPNKSTLDNLDRLAVDANNKFYTKPIKIHTMGGTVYQSHILPSIKDHLSQQRFNNEPHYQAHPMESSDGPQDSFTLAQEVLNRNKDAYVVEYEAISYLQSQFPEKTKAIRIVPNDPSLQQQVEVPPFSIFMKKDNTELKGKIDQAIKDLVHRKIDGQDYSIKELRKKLSTTTEENKKGTIKQAIREIENYHENLINKALDDAKASKPKEQSFIGKFFSGLKFYIRGTMASLVLAVDGLIIGFFLAVVLVQIKALIQENNKENKKKNWSYYVKNGVSKTLDGMFAVFNGVPIAAQVLMVYYVAGSDKYKDYFFKITPLYAGLIVIAVNAGINMAIAIMNKIKFLNQEQIQAAYALGMNKRQTFRYVVFGQAIRRSRPDIAKQFITNVKETAFLQIVGVVDIMYIAKQKMSIDMDPVLPFFTASVIYLVIILSANFIMKQLEKKKEVNHGISSTN
ncbi:transporter substrate-binding domain-containing protein [Candidatus Phytoplasma pruni]|nr:transporter substrate-binding domain-containing protein [Candidatus Phytoplasma pruni]